MRRKRRGRQASSTMLNLHHLQTLVQLFLMVRIASAAESGGIGGGMGGIGGVLACPAACRCRPDAREASCRGANLAHVPAEWSDQLRAFAKLDLAGNNITSLEEFDFVGLPEIEDLVLSDNRLEKIHSKTFARLSRLKRLVLQNCSLQEVPLDALHPLIKLSSLNLGSNKMSILSANSFGSLSSLVILLLKRNQIHTIEDDAFAGLDSLRVLELDDNLLTQIPVAITRLTALQELSVSGNRITFLGVGILQRTTSLTMLEIRGNPLLKVHPDAFSFLPRLRKLILSEARELREFPNFNGTSALEILRLDRANIVDTPNNLCITCPRLKSLDMKSNQLTRIPLLHDCTDLRLLDLTSNKITSLEGQPFRGLNQLHDLLLAHNQIQRLLSDSFLGLTRLQLLDLEDNVIVDIHPDAFLPFTQLEDLNLANNVFPSLPPHSTGWERLLHLKTFNNPALREIPPPQYFPRVQTLVLSYAYHCCAFLPDGIVPQPPQGPTPPSLPTSFLRPPLKETVLFPSPDADFDLSLWNSSHTDIWPQLQNLSKKFGKEINDLWDSFGTDFTYPGNLPAYVEEYFEEQESGKSLGVGSDIYQGRVQCLPLPGPFLPCEDLFDWWTLRCGVWIVFLLAMLGNGTVVFVLVFSRSKMDVPRFLVCNLAMADFFMGIYLGFLAVVDASTLGEFRKYAIPWQMSAGCQLAGFLGVLSSELSVYTLAVITLERNYAITHAMHLNKRLSLKHAAYIMAVGWSFALVMALLPLVGVSDYRIFAVCLPFEAERPHSLAYVVFLMLINGVAFLILMGCYLKMYCAIRGSQAWNSNDSRIAKRMALLVFTDFLCWSPIAFFSLTAAFGLQLVSLEQAKVFTVFVLPLNSCCNPFLYAILTKQFKKDCVLICKAIEESRVTRGIGRCRHSSNFSNRQTPANTNSLVDRSSREHVHGGGQIPCTCTAKLLTHGHLAAGGGMAGVDPSAQHVPTARGKSAGAGANAATTSTSSNSSAPVASTSSSARLRPGRGSSNLNPRRWFMGKASWLLCHRDGGRRGQGRNSGGRGTGGGGGNGSRARSDQYAHQIAEIQQKQHKRASSVSSENFSSSRSDSWRQNNCGLPLRLLDPKKRSSWLVTRKTSQDSNLSSSRNDSSGTATSASTATWRMSRSSASGCTAAAASATITAAAAAADTLSRPRSASPNSAVSSEQQSPPSISAAPANHQSLHHPHHYHPHDWTTVHHAGATPRTVLASIPRPKPRLTRQSAISDDEPPGSPGRLAVRFLTTIPSAAETSVQNDEEDQGTAEEDGDDDPAMAPLVSGNRSLPTVRLVALPTNRGAQQRRPSGLSSPPRTLVALQLLDNRPTALVPLRRFSTGQTSQVSPGGGSACSQNRSPQSVRSSPTPSPTISGQVFPCSPGVARGVGTGDVPVTGRTVGSSTASGTTFSPGPSRSTGSTGVFETFPGDEKPT